MSSLGRFRWSGEATVILKNRAAKVRHTGGYLEQRGFWSQSQNRPWVRTLSLSVAVTRTTESTSALARSYITRGSREGCAGDRWKRFLCLALPPAIG